MEQTRYGLIGSKLGHSYSKIIHEQIADYTYELMPLPTKDEARAFMERRDFAAINVTILRCGRPQSGGHRRGEYHRQPGWQAVRL